MIYFVIFNDFFDDFWWLFDDYLMTYFMIILLYSVRAYLSETIPEATPTLSWIRKVIKVQLTMINRWLFYDYFVILMIFWRFLMIIWWLFDDYFMIVLWFLDYM